VTTDATDSVPVQLDVSPAKPDGRGLHIVAAIADRWGHDLRDGRRTVWAVLNETGPFGRVGDVTVDPTGDLHVDVVDDPAAGRALVVTGEVDPDTAPRLRAAVQQAIEAGGDVVVDLADVRFIDSSGVAVLIGAHHQLRSTGRTLVLRQPSPMVRRVLELAQLTGELAIE
jgi:anti-sigma B factor antagonist